jgi:phytoene dehydrogenase-like protein
VFRPAASNLRHVLAQIPGIESGAALAVMRINVSEGRAAGVVLANGEEIPASLVLSGADPRRTLLEWVGAGMARAGIPSTCCAAFARVASWRSDARARSRGGFLHARDRAFGSITSKRRTTM